MIDHVKRPRRCYNVPVVVTMHTISADVLTALKNLSFRTSFCFIDLTFTKFLNKRSRDMTKPTK